MRVMMIPSDSALTSPSGADLGAFLALDTTPKNAPEALTGLHPLPTLSKGGNSSNILNIGGKKGALRGKKGAYFNTHPPPQFYKKTQKNSLLSC